MLAAVLVAGCGEESHSGYQGYLNRVGDNESGLVREHTVGQRSVRVGYLSGKYLAYQYLRSLDMQISSSTRDSIIRTYDKSFALRLTFVSADTEPLTSGASTYGEFRDRSLYMNFDLAKDIVIKYGQQWTSPVSAVLENDYAMNGRRSIMAYFANNPEIWKLPSFEVVYSDHLFDMGVLHFGFSTTDLQSVPNPLSTQGLH